MSVASAFTLPAQPALGLVTLSPLGGDGNQAPKSRFEVFNFRVAGDASAGTYSLTITLDPVYESLMMQLAVSHTAAADSEVAFQIVSRNAAGVALQALDCHTLAELGPGARVRALWCPPPLINATEVSVTGINVGVAEVYQLNVTVLNFNKRASERTPLNILYASLPRGTSKTTGSV